MIFFSDQVVEQTAIFAKWIGSYFDKRFHMKNVRK